MQLDIPKIRPIDYMPKSMIGFNYINSKPNFQSCIHFFLNDLQFERVWNKPSYYISKMSNFDSVLSPDFSLYRNMPIAMQIWNVYRSRYIGYLMQKSGLKTIPTVSWSDERSFDFCFDGLPMCGTLAIATMGIGKDKYAMKLFNIGYQEMINRLQPKNILIYGSIYPDFLKEKTSANIKFYQNENILRFRNLKNNKGEL